MYTLQCMTQFSLLLRWLEKYNGIDCVVSPKKFQKKMALSSIQVVLANMNIFSPICKLTVAYSWPFLSTLKTTVSFNCYFAKNEHERANSSRQMFVNNNYHIFRRYTNGNLRAQSWTIWQRFFLFCFAFVLLFLTVGFFT
jgi:hypothetical protein